jgi:hypothetical protein
MGTALVPGLLEETQQVCIETYQVARLCHVIHVGVMHVGMCGWYSEGVNSCEEQLQEEAMNASYLAASI